MSGIGEKIAAGFRCAAFGLALGGLAGPALAEAQAAPDCAMTPEEIFEALSPSIVEAVSISINPFLVYDRVRMSSGTGFVFGDGYIVTNYHVVADASEIYVLDGDQSMPHMLVGIDPALDIAVLEPMFLPVLTRPLEFADPADLRIGQTVHALGFPLGLGESISAGIVSGISRVLPRTTSSWLSPFIQTDAAISPGNSGGPLVDSCGRVVGMISSGIVGHGAENIAFAIPVEVLEPVVTALIENGYVSRPWHGLYGQMTTPIILQAMGIPSRDWIRMTGFLVETVEPGSAADKAGLIGGNWPIMWGWAEILIGGDIITHVNGTRIGDMDTAIRMVRSIEVGDRVELTFRRQGEVLTSSVIVEERPVLEQELEIYRHQDR